MHLLVSILILNKTTFLGNDNHLEAFTLNLKLICFCISTNCYFILLFTDHIFNIVTIAILLRLCLDKLYVIFILYFYSKFNLHPYLHLVLRVG